MTTVSWERQQGRSSGVVICYSRSLSSRNGVHIEIYLLNNFFLYMWLYVSYVECLNCSKAPWEMKCMRRKHKNILCIPDSHSTWRKLNDTCACWIHSFRRFKTPPTITTSAWEVVSSVLQLKVTVGHEGATVHWDGQWLQGPIKIGHAVQEWCVGCTS